MDRSVSPLADRKPFGGSLVVSEYQYFEFQAIDRPLSKKEMAELRCYSTRAMLTYAWTSTSTRSFTLPIGVHTS